VGCGAWHGVRCGHSNHRRAGDGDGTRTELRAGCPPRRTTYAGKQGPNHTPGVSAETAGSQGLWLGSVTLPAADVRPGAHVHDAHESAFYVLSGGAVELWTGPQLEHREAAYAGDFLYIPAGYRDMRGHEVVPFTGDRRRPPYPKPPLHSATPPLPGKLNARPPRLAR
jgi:uncharacterized RmlC-like cupin family protein